MAKYLKKIKMTQGCFISLTVQLFFYLTLVQADIIGH
jgi:hypothetical protein